MSEKLTRRDFLRRTAPLGLFPFMPEALLALNNGGEWGRFQPGDQAFGQATRAIEALFTAPNPGAKSIPNKLVRYYGPELSGRTNLIEERREINRGTMLRLRLVDREWAQVLPENDVYSPFENAGNDKLYGGPLYIQLKDFEPVVDLVPFSVLPETTKEQKQILVVIQPYPEVLLLEGDQIVLRLPVGVGTSKEPTPLGDFRIFSLRVSNHMPHQFIGIPFAMEFFEGDNLHGAYYYLWDKVKRGFFMSSGCVNLMTTDSPYAPRINGKKVSADRFLFQWALTNYEPFDTKKMEKIYVPWNSPEAADRMRVLIVNSINEIKTKSKEGKLTSWDPVIEKQKQLAAANTWVSPDIKVAGS